MLRKKLKASEILDETCQTKFFFGLELNFEGHCVEFYGKNRFVQFLLRPKVAKRGQNRSKKGVFRSLFFSRPKFDIISTQWP